MKKTSPEETPFSKFERFMKKLVAVPKESILDKPSKRFPLAKKVRKA